ncbi:MAG: peroxiredoxin-like family protein [Mycobacterium sp.]|nr:peroxiredoxin-like family protein [Mycobacterium sp.]
MTTADTQPSTVADRVDQMHRDMAGQLPEEVSAAFAAEQADLDARGIPENAAAPGDTTPDVPLLDVHGAPTTLAAELDGRPAVIVLYRGGWCPYCNLTLRAYQENLVPQLKQRGIPLLALSPQKPDGSLSTQEKNELTFTVLSDPANQLATALGVLTAPTQDARTAQRALGLDLPAVNADGGFGVPMPTVLVVDGSATIRWIDVHPNYTTRTEVADVVAAVDALN